MADVRAYIAGGHVYCHPYREDRDVADCLRCEQLMELNARSSPPYIVCDAEPAARPLSEDPNFVEWWHQHHRHLR